MRRSFVRTSGVALGAAAALAVTACAPAEVTPASTLEIGEVDLAAAGCPSPLVVQLDWNPESEYGHIYELVGDGYTVDDSAKSITGPLVGTTGYTGIDLEIRIGGSAVGFQEVPALMYQDPDIHLGYVDSGQAVQSSVELPTTAVFAPLDISPQMVMWDPETYSAETIEQLGTQLQDAGGYVRYLSGATWMSYLEHAGLLPGEVLDGSYQGTPAAFVAAAGVDAQQGFASAEPYIYEHEVEGWMKPLRYQLIHDVGWEIYVSAVSVRSDDLEQLAPCLTGLVPLLQQAQVDFLAEPDETIDLMLELIEGYDTGWVYSRGVADYSVATMLERGLAGNGANDTIGDFDDERMARVLETSVDLFESLGGTVADGLAAADIYTNEFIDAGVGR